MGNSIKLLNVSKDFVAGEGVFKALNNVNLEIEAGSVVSIIGPSGSGKTTLLNVMSTLLPVTSGDIFYGKENIALLQGEKASLFRLNHIGFVFQKYQLMPSLNIYDNICLPFVLANEKIDKDFIAEICDKLGISSQFKKMPGQLSGGQQQRVAIARALCRKPEVIFADEPTGNLDSQTGSEVMKLLIDCAREYHQTLIYVTHDMELAARADRQIAIRDGDIV